MHVAFHCSCIVQAAGEANPQMQCGCSDTCRGVWSKGTTAEFHLHLSVLCMTFEKAFATTCMMANASEIGSTGFAECLQPDFSPASLKLL